MNCANFEVVLANDEGLRGSNPWGVVVPTTTLYSKLSPDVLW